MSNIQLQAESNRRSQASTRAPSTLTLFVWGQSSKVPVAESEADHKSHQREGFRADRGIVHEGYEIDSHHAAVGRTSSPQDENGKYQKTEHPNDESQDDAGDACADASEDRGQHFQPANQKQDDTTASCNGSMESPLVGHTCTNGRGTRPTCDGRIWRGEKAWWATKDLNLGPLPCEGNALTN